jgi:Family of unknown function (DUF5694)
MRSVVSGLIVALFMAAPVAAAEKPVDVMVLGAYHFGNPGMDVNNLKVDSVLTPTRQAELDALARALLTFKPTRVMVERESDAPDFSMESYKSFTPERLKTAANEADQIGFRVAKMAGLAVVHGIDEQPKNGEPDYFPYDKLQETAKKFGQTGMIEKANAPVVAWLKSFEARQKTDTVAQLLIEMNIPNKRFREMAFYYDVLPIGDGNTQTGADLNAGWYLRNAKIFSKLMQVAKPGDRVLVIYGAGHGYWLRHFATETPGYRSIDVVPYLKQAKVKR